MVNNSSYENYNEEQHSNIIGYQDYSSRNTQGNNPDVTSHAVGKYDVIPKFHMKAIKKALNDTGINISGKTDEEIVEAYQNSPTAQDLHGKELASKELSIAERIKKETGTKAPLPELAYFIHAFGSGNTKKYIEIYQAQGQEAADKWLYEKTNVGGFKNPIPSSAIQRFRQRYNKLYGNQSSTTESAVENEPTKAAPKPTTPSGPVTPDTSPVVSQRFQQPIEPVEQNLLPTPTIDPNYRVPVTQSSPPKLPVTSPKSKLGEQTTEQAKKIIEEIEKPESFRFIMNNRQMFSDEVIEAYREYYQTRDKDSLSALYKAYKEFKDGADNAKNRQDIDTTGVGLAYQINRYASKNLGSEGEQTYESTSSIPIKDVDKGFKVIEVSKGGAGIWKYSNGFSRSEGEIYQPLPNRGNASEDDVYQGVEGIAHFILDTDLTNEYFHPYSVVNIRDVLTTGKTKDTFGGTNTENPFVALYKKNEDGTVNITYRPVNEIDKEIALNEIQKIAGKGIDKGGYKGFKPPVVTEDGYKIFAGLRQYKFSDVDWEKNPKYASEFEAHKGKHVGFGKTVKYMPSKPDEKGDTHPIYLIAGKGKNKNSFGQFGGASVVFLSPKADFAVDFTGSINDIEKAGKELLEKYNLEPDDLIMAVHDVGSFNAKLASDSNYKMHRSRYYEYNKKPWTGAALAIPANK